MIQIAVTFVGFLSSAYGAVNLPTRLESVFSNVPILRDYAAGTALIVETILLAAFFIVFGELVPKTLALAHTDRYALVLAAPVDVLGRLLRPVVWLLSGITRVITRALGMKDTVQVDIAAADVKDGDIFLLCSDGLSGMVEPPTLRDLLKVGVDLDDAAHKLVEAANQAGGLSGRWWRWCVRRHCGRRLGPVRTANRPS